MSDATSSANLESNPFATRNTRPGAVPYCFPEGQSLAGVLTALRQQAGWGQIVGPHGSGKTTLICELTHALHQGQTTVQRYQLREGEADIGWYDEQAAWTSSTQVIVDGYEQQSLVARWRLRRACRRVGCGLLITSHRRVFGFPLLLRTATSVELAQHVVGRLLRERPSLVTPREVQDAFEACRGNLRETLFWLYDLAEQRGPVARRDVERASSRDAAR